MLLLLLECIKVGIESLVKRITGFADMIQLTHLKVTTSIVTMVPDGVYLDADGLAEIDLGNGTNYNPQEALNMFFQTGSVIGRSFTSKVISQVKYLFKKYI